jgi:hypothetical protein
MSDGDSALKLDTGGFIQHTGWAPHLEAMVRAEHSRYE